MAHCGRSPSRNGAPSNHTHFSEGGGAEREGDMAAIMFFLPRPGKTVWVDTTSVSSTSPGDGEAASAFQQLLPRHHSPPESLPKTPAPLRTRAGFVLHHLAGLFLVSLTSCITLH